MTTSLDKGDTGGAPAPQIDSEQLDRSLVRGIAWTGSIKWGSQVVAWASTLTVARLLSPNDYGIVSMATVYLGVLMLLSDFGVGTGVVALRDQTEEELAQLNGLAVLLGIAGFLISCLVAIPLGRFFSSPQLPLVLVVMSTSFVIASFRSVPGSLLQKELRFKLLSIIDGIRTIGLAVVTVILALAGLRYWTLVVGAIGSALVSTLMILSRRRHRFAWPRFSSLRKQMRFSRDIIISNLAWYGYSNADFVVAGRMFGQAALGTYAVAWNLANAPLEKITTMVGSVTPAYFSAVQNDNAALRRYLLKPTEAISLIVFPALSGLAFVAREAVPLILGQKWAGLILPLQLLAILSCVRCVVPLLAQVLLVKGETTFLMWNALASVIVLPASFVIGSRWGTAGIAAAWVMAYPVVAVPLYLRARRKIDLHFREYFQALRPAVEGTLAMSIALLLLKWIMPTGMSPLPRLLLLIFAGTATYAAVQLTLHRERLASFRRAARMIRR